MAQRQPKHFSEYQEMRKSNPKHYYSSKIQRELMQDRQALGQQVFYSKPGEVQEAGEDS